MVRFNDLREISMMDNAGALEELKVIRSLMERPVKYSTQSGLAGVLAGLIALAGMFTDMYISKHFEPVTAVGLCFFVWGGVLVLSLLAVVGLTRLREIRQNMPIWSAVKTRILLAILPPAAAGIGLTLAIIYRWYMDVGPNEWGLILPIWMLFYGVACWQVGEFSVRELRWMGAAFVLTGLITAAFLQFSPYLMFGVTFGGFHILYGVIVWIRYGG
jgi:hypothetical protein